MRFWCLLLLVLVTIVVTEARPKSKKNHISRDAGDSQDDFVETIKSKQHCGYDSCTKPVKGMLNVHLVPHTHDDVGWLKTVDQYFYGSQSLIQKAGVQYILDSVISELQKDSKKKFIYVETAYLWKWWKQQHDTMRHQVRKLVNEGRLEFIGGAWTMNDEAVTHYQSTVDQFTWGFRKLNETFGECGRPRVGWQIDPFGHSREMASLFAQMGFDGMFFGRLDYQDKLRRLDTKTAEMIWQGSANLGKVAELFTGVLYNNYGPPPGFCFDVLCSDEPIIDDKSSADFNAYEKITTFIYYAETQAKRYATNNVIMTMGGDFTYMDAAIYYQNLDKLISHTNARQTNGSRVNVFYSTPSCYLKSLQESGKSWPVKRDDFFPYASDPHAYWTGYFSSRPTLKYFERVGNNVLQVCKQLYSLAGLGVEDWADLNKLREAMGVMQHHDAITGTEKQRVAQDYARILYEGIEECEQTSQTALRKLMTLPSKKNKERAGHHEVVIEAPPKMLALESCLALNVSQCAVTEGSTNFVVTLYNPLAHSVSQYVRLPVVPGSSYSVRDASGADTPMQLVPIPAGVLNIPGRFSNATIEVVFRASDLPPLGFKSYYVTRIEPQEGQEVILESLYTDVNGALFNGADEIVLGNSNVSVGINRNSGLVATTKWNDLEIPTSQSFFFYRGAVGNNEEFENRSSGAYIFRPNGTEYQVNKNVAYKVVTGAVVDEIHQVFDDWVSQVIRVYKQENHVEFDWVVGPIPINDTLGGKEVVSRFYTNIQSNGTFYTDSNGREMLKRVRNQRPTWEAHIVEPIAGNYYPVTARIRISDPQEGAAFSLLNDRAQGGSSLADGALELMVHRRLLHDDAFGVGEALNEQAFGTGLVARGQHYAIAGRQPDGHPTLASRERELAQRKLLKAWTFFSDASDLTFEQFQSQFRNEYSGLRFALPKNVHVLTLEPWKARSLLIRLEHVLELNEDPILSKPISVNLKELFAPFTIKEIRETTLGGNQWLSEAKRLKFTAGADIETYGSNRDPTRVEPVEAPVCNCKHYDSHGNEVNATEHSKPADDDTVKMADFYLPTDKFNVTLKAMQIRTFVVEIKR